MKTIKIIMDVPKDLYAMWMARGLSLGTPLDKVIEDIKREIEEKAKEREFYLDSGHPHNGLYEALEIIDKHLQKGE